MSNFLAIDTSLKYFTVLAVKGEKIVLNHLPECAMRHSVVLMGEVDKALREAELAPAGCDFFAAVTGPGSFTGIRIGISAVKGFAVGTGKKMLALTSFEVIAYNVADENFYTVIDAAHGHYYACGFSAGKKVASAPAYLSEEQVLALDSPLYGFEELNLPRYTKINIEDGFYRAVIANAENLSDDIAATYLRKSQAEEGRK